MSKRLWVLPIMVVLLVMAVGGLAYAAPSLSGPTGVVATPTAEIAPESLASVVLSYQALKPNGDRLRNWELQALGSVANQAELWLAYSSIKNSIDSHLWGIGGKVQVYHTPDATTAIAVGGGWMDWKDGLWDWAQGLPLRGQVKWANSTPAAVQNEIKSDLGLRSLTFTATPSPATLDQAGGLVTLTVSNIVDSVADAVHTVSWSPTVTPAGAATAPAPADQLVATSTVNTLEVYTPRTIRYSVTVTSNSPTAGVLTATKIVSVVQSYHAPVGAAAVAAISNQLASMPVVGKDPTANMASVKSTLANVTQDPVGAGPANPAVWKKDVKSWNLYAVATADLSKSMGSEWGAGTKLLGSLGVMYIKADPEIGDSMSLTRPFVNAKFVAADGTALGLEYRWRNRDLDNRAIFSAVVSHAFTNQLVAELGTTNMSPIGLGLHKQDWFIRVGYQFPMGKY